MQIPSELKLLAFILVFTEFFFGDFFERQFFRHETRAITGGSKSGKQGFVDFAG